ncbi:PH domain-containing protein [Gracilimonas mengyeensis]|uniref:PH domain-containing protein n=1 Tax=Gracilimonas mengyeensis TaxID=1302730 RepID=A0A521AEE6_9BACT|nr:PH domain-containing protein [Gracilimonas mengyeensis]SMO33070.1 PH domain-containing protein [Gracilimonas mengyeensis]
MGLFSGLLGNAGTVEPEKLQQEYEQLLTESEDIEIGFKLVRDVFIFTNKRLILVNKQGLTGNKVEYLSVSYGSISRFSIESSGHFDLEAELKIWISSEQHPSITRQFSKKVNIYDVQKVLAKYALG